MSCITGIDVLSPALKFFSIPKIACGLLDTKDKRMTPALAEYQKYLCDIATQYGHKSYKVFKEAFCAYVKPEVQLTANLVDQNFKQVLAGIGQMSLPICLGASCGAFIAYQNGYSKTSIALAAITIITGIYSVNLR